MFSRQFRRLCFSSGLSHNMDLKIDSSVSQEHTASFFTAAMPAEVTKSL
jgi:hypothetical protein